jgi:hypothetical protein
MNHLLKNNNVKTIKSFIFLSLLAFVSCQKEDDTNPGGNSGDTTDGLTAEEAAILDAQPEAPRFNLSEVILPNGFAADYYLKNRDSVFYDQWRDNPPVCESPVACKNLLIAKMMTVGLYLTERSNFQYTAGASDEPAQNGLAYSYGGKNYKVRQKPPTGGCTDKVYGLDCSGFIYQLFNQSGVTTFPNGTADTQRKPETIKNALEKAFPEWSDIEVKEMGKLKADSLESGDIIYWKHSDGKAFHIGIVLKGPDSQLAIFQSNGYGGDEFNADECKNNYGNTRGPRLLKLTELDLFKAGYGITRIIAKPFEWYIDPGLTSKIIQDGNGIKWIATYEGLYRFDGTDWTHYTSDNSQLPDNYILDIALDNSGALWIGTLEAGIAVLSGNGWTIYNTSNSDLKHNTIESIAIDRQNNKWIGFVGRGMMKFNGGSWDWIYWTDNSHVYTADHIAVDASGNAWIADSDGLAMYDGATWAKLGLPGSENNFITSITIDEYNTKWIGTAEGLATYNGGWEFLTTANSQLTTNFVTAITFDEEKNTWIGTIGTNSGLSKKGKDGIWKHYTLEQGQYPFANVQSIILDDNQNVWMAGSLGVNVLFREGG